MKASDYVIEIVQDLECRYQGTITSINGRTLTGVLRDIAERVRVVENDRAQYRDALNGICGMLGLTDGDGLPDMPEVIRTEIERRLMPPGMEWPKFEDGETVLPGNRLLDKNGGWFEAVSFVFTCDWWSVRGYRTEGFGDLNGKTRRTLRGMAYGTRVKRPDSWERLEEDARKDRCSYFGINYQDCGHCEQSASACSIEKARDLVRRARALAGDA